MPHSSAPSSRGRGRPKKGGSDTAQAAAASKSKSGFREKKGKLRVDTMAKVTTTTASTNSTARVSATSTYSPYAYSGVKAFTRLRVLVIGAGVSGLACARELVAKGHEVKVVEGRRRVGGRVNTAQLELSTKKKRASKQEKETKTLPHIATTLSTYKAPTSSVCAVDMGGMFVHGIDDNPIHRLVEQAGVRSRSYESTVLYDDPAISKLRGSRGGSCGGGKIIDKEVDTTIEDIWNSVLSKAHRSGRVSDTSDDFIPNHRTEKETFQQIINRVTPKSDAAKLKKGSVERRIFNWHQANLELSCGVDLDKIGREWNEDEAWGFEGEHHVLVEGFGALTSKMAEGLDIKFDAQVSKIETWNPKKGIDKQTKKHIPESEYGSLNTSLKHMKDGRGGVTVTTTSGEEIDADCVVVTLPLGVLKTDMVEFSPPLPARKAEAIEKVGFGVLNKCAISFPHKFWPDEDFIGVASENKGEVFLFTNMAVAEGKPVLCCMFGGSFAASIEQHTDNEIVSMCLSVLSSLFPRIPSPVDYYVSRWSSDKFARGSFCYVPPNCTGVEHYHLASPLCDGKGDLRVLFAGEHTCSTHPSTVHGAFLSGIREAYRLDLTYERGHYSKDMIFEWDPDVHELYQETFSLDGGEEAVEGRRPRTEEKMKWRGSQWTYDEMKTLRNAFEKYGYENKEKILAEKGLSQRGEGAINAKIKKLNREKKSLEASKKDVLKGEGAVSENAKPYEVWSKGVPYAWDSSFMKSSLRSSEVLPRTSKEERDKVTGAPRRTEQRKKGGWLTEEGAWKGVKMQVGRSGEPVKRVGPQMKWKGGGREGGVKEGGVKEGGLKGEDFRYNGRGEDGRFKKKRKANQSVDPQQAKKSRRLKGNAHSTVFSDVELSTLKSECMRTLRGSKSFDFFLKIKEKHATLFKDKTVIGLWCKAKSESYI
ncbi:hypothetical protein TrVE_jg2055 [Triparma verrucosa]|uniref:Amine oxidase domain-containing protein n=1 Tax=Triparma verrucosa TaxID=1606542 RepID=A0A9W7BLX5_9STRA|nr:hypothetical protein TrVE_jg2055 [Triparma verrucosa]